ncbi:MAG: TraB/GumN family protein [Proteobacteria bacterium]|nr:TraB/GumN family protein [Pseudomonadota bacterium]
MGRTKSRWLLALSLFGCLSAHAAGPVWALHGAHSTVYLAGSVHVLPADEKLPAAFDKAYADSDKLVMEIDLANLDEMQAAGWMAEHGTLAPGERLQTLVGAQTYARVTTVAAQLQLPMAMLDHQAPWMVGIEISDKAYEQAGYRPEQGVEEQLLARVRADHKATAGLETLQQQLGGLIALSPQDQAHLLEQCMDDLQTLEADMKDVLTAWRGGDAARLGSLLSAEYDSFPALYRPLVTDRNQRWLPQIEQLLKGNENAMVVVGSLHLVGKGGLLELLRKDGYPSSQLN